MRVKWSIILFLLCSLAVPSFAAEVVNKVVFEVDSISVNSDFDAGTGQLTWSNGGIATLRYDGGTKKYRVNVDAVWSDMTDLSIGGLAKAAFNVGNFTATFFNLVDTLKTTPIASVSGSLFTTFDYGELETQQNPSELYGAAVVQLTSWNVPGYVWSEGLGAPAGLTATTSNLNPSNIVDYQSNWSSDNTILSLLADETGIPEPATIVLLGLGGLGLLRKRSK